MSMRKIIAVSALASVAMLSGCSTTTSTPYKASTSNVISIQKRLQPAGVTVSLGEVSAAEGVDENPMCRLMGPVKVAPGKSMAQYIKDAFQEELFMARVYSVDAPVTINAQITELAFSSVTPANWTVGMKVSSNISDGYAVKVEYPFDTSWDAYSACKNVADAFGPAVQELLKQVVNHPKFVELAKPAS